MGEHEKIVRLRKVLMAREMVSEELHEADMDTRFECDRFRAVPMPHKEMISLQFGIRSEWVTIADAREFARWVIDMFGDGA